MANLSNIRVNPTARPIRRARPVRSLREALAPGTKANTSKT